MKVQGTFQLQNCRQDNLRQKNIQSQNLRRDDLRQKNLQSQNLHQDDLQEENLQRQYLQKVLRIKKMQPSERDFRQGRFRQKRNPTRRRRLPKTK